MWKRDVLSIIYERKGIIKKEKWSMVRGSTSKGDNVSLKSEDRKDCEKRKTGARLPSMIMLDRISYIAGKKVEEFLKHM